MTKHQLKISDTCKNGHDISKPDSLYIYPERDGYGVWRACKECKRAQSKEYQRRKYNWCANTRVSHG